MEIAHDVRHDLRHAFRNLSHRTGFTTVVVGTLALGIGANAVLFAVLHAVLLRPLPYEEPGRLVVVWESAPQRDLPFMFAAPPNYADWRAQNRVFEEMATWERTDAFLGGEGEPERVQAAAVSASLFPLLGVAPRLGRTFSPGEDRPGGPPAVVLGHTLWQRRFGADPGVVGRDIEVDGLLRTVVGVMPPSFDFPPSITLEGTAAADRTELWLPLATDLAGGQRGAHYLTVAARLAPGVSQERAAADMAAITRRLERDYPGSNEGWEIALVPLHEQLYGPTRPALLVLMGAVALVLVIVCLNVANLFLVRHAGRRRELAIRAALGADRGRLTRQLLVESLALALAGGVAGLALARWTLGVVTALAPHNVPRLADAGVDAAVAGFTLALSLAVGVVFGLAPAWRGAAPDLATWLKERGSEGPLGGARLPLRNVLVVAEVALSLVLLAGAGLLLRSFHHLRGVDTGFRPSEVLTLGVTLPEGGYPERAQWNAPLAEIERRVASLPEVEAAGLTLELPLTDDRQGTSFTIAGEGQPPPGEERRANFTFITPGYLPAMGVPLVRGRLFGSRDHAEAPPVVLINEALATQYFADDNPLGQRLHVGFSPRTAREIVGVVGDVRHDKLRRGGSPGIYLPYAQLPWSRRLALAVRSPAEPATLLPRVRSEIRAVDADVPIHDVRRLGEIVAAARAPERFSTTLLSVFAALALLLAAVGIYGVIAYSVQQRTREIGIRMALGARRGAVTAMVLRYGLALTTLGVVLGLAAALALSRILDNLVFEVSTTDPATLATGVVVLGMVALAACFLPARRASGVDPTVALRDE